MIRQSGIKAFTPQVQAVDFNDTYYYYLRNGQGDIVKLIDGSKTTVVEYTYDSWGKPLSCTGTLATTLGVLNPFRYRGYVYDEETGFYYLKSRYYDPETCRFISADVLLSTGQGVLGHNCYAYCMNAPVSGYDPDGKSMTAILVGIAVAGIIGGCFSVASGGKLYNRILFWSVCGGYCFLRRFFSRGILYNSIRVCSFYCFIRGICRILWVLDRHYRKSKGI